MSSEPSDTRRELEYDRIRDVLQHIEYGRLRDGYRQRVTLVAAGLMTALTAALAFSYFSGGSRVEAAVIEQLDSRLGELKARIQEDMTTVPVGGVIAWPAPIDIPQGWVPCDGRQLPAPEYRKLAAVIGQHYGEGTDVVTVPDYRGYFLRGVDANGQRDPDFASREGGPAVGSTQADSIRATRVPFTLSPANGSSAGLDGGGARFVQERPLTLHGGNETRPKNIYVHWIIRAR